jgi:MFS family permease
MKAVVETSDMRRDSAPPGLAGLPRAVVRLGWVSFLTDVSSEMIVPLLPAFLATLSGVPAMALGWIEGVAETTASFAKIFSGRFTDRAKAKKPLVLLGYGLSSLARPIIGLAPSWPAVVLIRFVDRVGKGIRTAPRDTMIANAAPPERRGAAYGLHRAFDNAGAVLGPLVAAGLVGWLGFSLRSVFLLAAIPAALSLLVLALGVKEKSEEHEKISKEKTTDPSTGPSHEAHGSEANLPPVFWRAAWLIAFFTLAASSDTFLLLKAREIGVAAGWLPVLWAFSNAVKSAFSMWGGGLSDRYGRRRLLLAAWVAARRAHRRLFVLLLAFRRHRARTRRGPRARRVARARVRLDERSHGLRRPARQRRLRAPLGACRLENGVPDGSRDRRNRRGSPPRSAVSPPAPRRVRSPSCRDPSGNASASRELATPAARLATSFSPRAPWSTSRSRPIRAIARPAMPAMRAGTTS